MVSEYSHCRRVAGAVGQVQHTDLAQHVHVTATDALLAFRHPEADTHMKKIKKKIDFGICTQVGSIQGSKRQFSVCPLQTHYSRSYWCFTTDTVPEPVSNTETFYCWRAGSLYAKWVCTIKHFARSIEVCVCVGLFLIPLLPYPGAFKFELWIYNVNSVYNMGIFYIHTLTYILYIWDIQSQILSSVSKRHRVEHGGKTSMMLMETLHHLSIGPLLPYYINYR